MRSGKGDEATPRKDKGRQIVDVDKSLLDKEYKLWKSGRITAAKALFYFCLKQNTFYSRL